MDLLTTDQEQKLIDDELNYIFNSIYASLSKSLSEPIHSLRDLEAGNFDSPQDRKAVIDGLMLHAAKAYHYSVMDYLFAAFDNPLWYKGEGDLLTQVIDFLFKNFERTKLWHGKYLNAQDHIDMEKGDFYYAKSFDEIVRARIGMSINYLLKPSSKIHREKYFEKLSSLLKDKEFGSGRVDLVVPYARMGKKEVVAQLIEMIDDRDVAQNVIKELGRIKAVDAIPKLEKIIADENNPIFVMDGDDIFHKDLARKAIRQIEKDTKTAL